eukprot:TRINITY_DN20924_c0_g2_i1.p1 TRINITY_DN20924_c0_g2~~TRINITY_DN20924_c0_g2_i1.p1  ORF type:complete len:609 (-),score=40.42 TRINITY_DN20924_c0_g2_i1:31-1857(-)
MRWLISAAHEEASWLSSFCATLLLTLLLVTLPGQSAAQRRSLFPPRSGQHVLDFAPPHLDTLMSSGNFWIVMYYADWCGHCQHFAPTWSKVAKQFDGDPRVTFGALNCAAHVNFCRDLGIPGFPTLAAYNVKKNKDSRTKRGFRFSHEVRGASQAAIVDWVRKKLKARSEGERKGQPEPAREPPAEDSHESAAKTSSDRAEEKRETNSSSAVSTARPSAGGASQAPQRPPTQKGTAGFSVRITDAIVALHFAFRQGVFLNATTVEGEAGSRVTVLADGPLETHLDWLDYLAASFPHERAQQDLRMLAADARKAADRFLQGKRGRRMLTGQVWEALVVDRSLGGVPAVAGLEPEAHFGSCSTYTCGLWSLFHMLTLISEENSEAVPLPSDSATPDSDQAESQEDTVHARAADVRLPKALRQIKRFVSHFFGCRDCATHFLESFERCDFGICGLTPNDASGAALWLWQKHNAVSRRVANERGLPLPQPWPLQADCPACWDEDGSFNEENVVSHLRKSYGISQEAYSKKRQRKRKSSKSKSVRTPQTRTPPRPEQLRQAGVLFDSSRISSADFSTVTYSMVAALPVVGLCVFALCRICDSGYRRGKLRSRR